VTSEPLSRTPITVRLEGVEGEVRGELVRLWAPRTVEAILRALPLEGKASLWGEEVYFQIPVKMGLEKERSTVEVGAIAYWPMGSALCFFYGSTQPYSPVNLVGRVTDGLTLLSKVRSGARVRVERG